MHGRIELRGAGADRVVHGRDGGGQLGQQLYDDDLHQAGRLVGPPILAAVHHVDCADHSHQDDLQRARGHDDAHGGGSDDVSDGNDDDGGQPNYIVTHCVKNPLTPLGGVCVPGNTGPPNWIQTDCNPVYGGGPVSSCTPGTTTVGNLTTVCSNPAGPNNQTANAPSCVDDPAGSAPNWIHVTCGAVTQTVTNAPVDPATCVVGSVGPGPSYYTTSYCSPLTPAGMYPVATAVPSCPGTGSTTGPGPSFIVTTCTHPPATNFNQARADLLADRADARRCP